MPAEWDRFKFDIGSENSRELTTVRHVVHAPFARRIVEDERIKAGLVYDESRVNKSRISVAWVSANTWGLGSIYGTVEFQFAWSDLVDGQKIYWVEAMNYRPNAYRLLLSKRDIPTGLIVPYNPAKDQGPLRLAAGKYYWNSAYTSEFMIEDDLSLNKCTGLDFVLHHQEFCRPFGNGCKDRQSQPATHQTGGRMLAFVMGSALHVLDKHFKPQDEIQPFMNLDTAYRGLELELAQGEFGGPIATGSKCQDVVRGSLALYGADQDDQARRLLALISSKETFLDALKDLIRGHFDDPNWQPF
jgi:hypothetical protein